jgi:hypothetical protein
MLAKNEKLCTVDLLSKLVCFVWRWQISYNQTTFKLSLLQKTSFYKEHKYYNKIKLEIIYQSNQEQAKEPGFV